MSSLSFASFEGDVVDDKRSCTPCNTLMETKSALSRTALSPSRAPRSNSLTQIVREHGSPAGCSFDVAMKSMCQARLAVSHGGLRRLHRFHDSMAGDT